jgi:hypothetical protein
VDPTETLLTIAEVGLGIAGFSGVMTAFIQRPGALTRIEIYRISVLLGASFGAMFLAFVPLVLTQFSQPLVRIWGAASAIMCVYSLVGATAYLVASRRISRHAPEIFNRYLFATVTVGHLANIGLKFFNVVAANAASASGIYIVGLLWYVLHAAIQFSRMLFIQPAAR